MTDQDYYTNSQAMQALGLSRQSIYRVAARCSWRTKRTSTRRLWLKADVDRTPTGEARYKMRGQPVTMLPAKIETCEYCGRRKDSP